MIKIFSWTFKVLIWTILYYLITSKLINWLDQDIKTIPNINMIIFYICLGVSFITSFEKGIFNFKNLKLHLIPLIASILPFIGFLFLNICIWILNILTKILSLEKLKYLILDLYDPSNSQTRVFIILIVICFAFGIICVLDEYSHSSTTNICDDYHGNDEILGTDDDYGSY